MYSGVGGMWSRIGGIIIVINPTNACKEADMSNKYTYSVPFTEEQLHEDYVVRGMSQDEIATKYSTSQHVVWRAMAKMGITARTAAKRDQRGGKNSSWKGGRVLHGVRVPDGKRYLSEASPHGYWMVRMPSHPMASSNGYVHEHVVVALLAAGRDRLNPKTECVHHINFDKRDNRPENLLICTKDKHREYHAKLEALTQKLLAMGIVAFEPENGYVLGGERG
jgi:hypothetical protein